jgi:hypothetical protein
VRLVLLSGLRSLRVLLAQSKLVASTTRSLIEITFEEGHLETAKSNTCKTSRLLSLISYLADMLEYLRV